MTLIVCVGDFVSLLKALALQWGALLCLYKSVKHKELVVCEKKAASVCSQLKFKQFKVFLEKGFLSSKLSISSTTDLYLLFTGTLN